MVSTPTSNEPGRDRHAPRTLFLRARPGRDGVREPPRPPVAFTVENPRDLSGDEHPYARELGAALRRAGVPVVMYRVP